MAIDPAQLTVVTFKVEQQELSDLLTGTERWYQRIPRFEEQPTDPVNPDSREAKVRSRVLPRNPYFKECCREAREVLGIPTLDNTPPEARGSMPVNASKAACTRGQDGLDPAGGYRRA